VTNTKKYIFAYVLAAFALLSSFMLWTEVVAQYLLADISIVWTLPPMQEWVEEEEEENDEDGIIHPAAVPQAEKESIQEAEQEEENVEEVVPTGEQAHWELRNAYTLAIPSIGVRTPVVLPSLRYWDSQDWDFLEQQMQVGLSLGSVAYPHSALPGRRGTLIVAGHSSPPDARARESAYGHLFARLPELKIGQEITVTFGGETVTYIVENSQVVSSSETSILKQDRTGSILRLITCFPVGTTKDRLVVTARRA
jgi:LPXTG-site transpeptidase (sortase) family protein